MSGLVQLRRLAECLDGRRIPLNSEQRAEMPGEVPYWGANGVVDHVDRSLFDERLVLLGEDGAPFDDPLREVAFLVDGPVWINNHIHVLRPFGDVDARYLTYSLNAIDWMPHVGGSTRLKLTQGDMMSVFVPLRSLVEQRAIADYLDTETARIDALITKKQQLIHLLEERRWVAFARFVGETGAVPVPIRRLLTFLTDGPFGSAFGSADYVDAGLGVVRLGNIGFAEFRADGLVYLPIDRWSQFGRYTVRDGDLLVAALGDSRNHAGRACVARNPGPMIVKGKCFCARVDQDRADADYLAMWLSSPTSAEVFGLVSQGSTRQMINLEILRSQCVPMPSLQQQREIVYRTGKLWRQLDDAIELTRTQVKLLVEQRQAIVAGSVTNGL